MYGAVNLFMGGNMSYKAAWMIMMWFAVKILHLQLSVFIIAPRIYYAVRRSAYQHSHSTIS